MIRRTVALSDNIHRAIQSFRGAWLVATNTEISYNEVLHLLLVEDIVNGAEKWGTGPVKWTNLIDQQYHERFQEILDTLVDPNTVKELYFAMIAQIGKEVE